MRWRHVVVVAGLALATPGFAADEPGIENFAGSWKGVELQVEGDAGDLALEPKDLDVQIQSSGSGFSVSWTGLVREDGGPLKRQSNEASFVATDRPGVYAFEPGGASMFSRLFADPATGNPLTGETLLWARLAGETLTIYSLAVDSRGRFDLVRYARTLRAGGLDVHFTQRLENDRVVTVEGRAEAGGG
jgi:hypothetical protein